MKKRTFIALILCLLLLVIPTSGCFNSIDNFDFKTVVNNISVNGMKGNVSVYVSHIPPSKKEEALATGSGAIIKVESRKDKNDIVCYDYYFLTNNHVVFPENVNAPGTTYSNLIYRVCDYRSNNLSPFSADLIAHSAEYDLALLKFTGSTEYPLYSFRMREYDPILKEHVFALGYPNYQVNSLTVGTVSSYKNAPLSDSSFSKISFSVFIHNANIYHGSSGGAVLDKDMNLIGINYMGGVNPKTEEFVCAYAVPISKVFEFLNKVEFSLDAGAV